MSKEAENTPLTSEKTMVENDLTVSELFESWIVYEKDNNSKISAKTLFLYYAAFLKPVFGDRYVSDITYEEWSGFVEWLSNPGDTEQSRMTAESAKRAFEIFHKMFAYGKAKLGLNNPTVKRNASPRVQSRYKPKSDVTSSKALGSARKQQAQRKPVEYVFSHKVTDLFTNDEIEQMKSHMIWYNKTHICVMLCLYAGLSHSELSGLQWGDINIESKIVQIRRIYYRRFVSDKAGATELVVGPPKNRRAIRDIPIPEWLADKLAPIKQVYDDSDYVFTGNKNIMHAISFGSRSFPRFLEWVGLKGTHSFEALKNTYVKSCFDSGMSVERISLLIGDSDMKFTINRHFEIKE